MAIRRFALHFLEMCVAMCAGGAVANIAVFGAATLLGFPNLVALAPELAIVIIAFPPSSERFRSSEPCGSA